MHWVDDDKRLPSVTMNQVASVALTQGVQNARLVQVTQLSEIFNAIKLRWICLQNWHHQYCKMSIYATINKYILSYMRLTTVGDTVFLLQLHATATVCLTPSHVMSAPSLQTTKKRLKQLLLIQPQFPVPIYSCNTVLGLAAFRFNALFVYQQETL